jgi:hypothetical protein
MKEEVRQMELALTYALMDAQRRDNYQREQSLLGIEGNWYAFHESQEHKVSVFAGRRMGKTYNIALRASRSQYDCEIFTPYAASISSLIEEFRRINTEGQRIQSDRRTAQIIYADGRRINIQSCLGQQIRHQTRGRLWTNKEIFIDEFDCTDLESLMDRMESQIPRAQRIFCVGSLNRITDSYAKRWFKESNLHYFIDSEDFLLMEGQRPEDFRPSIARQFISNLPPLSMMREEPRTFSLT